LTTHNHNFEKPEAVDILQDDIVFISGDGVVYGSEYGFYVKCSDVPSHKTITKAVHSEGSVLENVWVSSDGEVEFQNFHYTHNSRAIIPRSNMDGAASEIDLPGLNLVIYNTRRPELPPIGRLTSSAQAAAFYGLGESIITSAEDPARAGEAKRVVGFDPFVLGDHSLNINRMKSILDSNSDVEVLILNTGYVGDESNNIRVEDTLACIEGALRGTIEWELDQDLNYEVPKSIDGVDLDRLNPRTYYGEEKFRQLMTELREDRISYLRKFEGIDPSIINSV
jgi:phosphoenolpyruvate carboxykinase (ATP)